jgi:hypothetical protein
MEAAQAAMASTHIRDEKKPLEETPLQQTAKEKDNREAVSAAKEVEVVAEEAGQQQPSSTSEPAKQPKTFVIKKREKTEKKTESRAAEKKETPLEPAPILFDANDFPEFGKVLLEEKPAPKPDIPHVKILSRGNQKQRREEQREKLQSQLQDDNELSTLDMSLPRHVIITV